MPGHAHLALAGLPAAIGAAWKPNPIVLFAGNLAYGGIDSI